MTDISTARPDRMVSVRTVFGIDSGLMVPAFSERDDHVPDIDEVYRFNPEVTLAILAGFMRERRVMVQVCTAPVNPPISNRLPHA